VKEHSFQLPVSSSQPETGNWKLETGNWKLRLA
jgi:hypothetical protein